MPYIYALKDGDGNVIYIGKANDPNDRFKSHMRDSMKRDTPIYRWIRKNGPPTMEVVSGDIENWQDEERRLIALHRSQGNHLLNVADGGDCPYCPPEVRVKNGRRSAKIRMSGPKARLNELKRELGDARKRGYLAWKTEVKLGELARSMPWLLPKMTDWGLNYGPTKPV